MLNEAWRHEVAVLGGGRSRLLMQRTREGLGRFERAEGDGHGAAGRARSVEGRGRRQLHRRAEIWRRLHPTRAMMRFERTNDRRDFGMSAQSLLSLRRMLVGSLRLHSIQFKQQSSVRRSLLLVKVDQARRRRVMVHDLHRVVQLSEDVFGEDLRRKSRQQCSNQTGRDEPCRVRLPFGLYGVSRARISRERRRTERVDAPDTALREDFMLVHGDQRSCIAASVRNSMPGERERTESLGRQLLE